MKSRVVIKSSKSGMSVYLDPDCTFEELLEDIGTKFRDSAKFWAKRSLVADAALLDKHCEDRAK